MSQGALPLSGGFMAVVLLLTWLNASLTRTLYTEIVALPCNVTVRQISCRGVWAVPTSLLPRSERAPGRTFRCPAQLHGRGVLPEVPGTFFSFGPGERHLRRQCVMLDQRKA